MSVTVAVGPYFPFMNRCRGTNACWVVIVSRHAKDTFIWCSSSWHGVLSLTSDCLAKPKVNYLICALWHFKWWFVSWGCVLTLRFFFYPPGWQLGNNRTRRGWISSGSLKKRSHLLETVFFFHLQKGMHTEKNVEYKKNMLAVNIGKMYILHFNLPLR